MQASLSARISEFGRGLWRAWHLLGTEQRVAAVGSLLLIVSTFGAFTWIEAAELLTAFGVLLLLKRRADGYQFHLPFGDGTAIAAAGAWCGLLILVRLFDRPFGQSVLALACAALVLGAGLRERAKRPMDDLPPETEPIPRPADQAPAKRAPADAAATERVAPDAAPSERIQSDAAPTERVQSDAAPTERIPPDGAPTERIPEPRDPEAPPG
jgi:hypothetical protein